MSLVTALGLICSRAQYEGVEMILGVFTELLAPGGIQRIGRHFSAALAALAKENGWSYRILSLNDPPGWHEVCVGTHTFSFQGFGHERRRFSLAVLRASPRVQKALLGHVNLAPIGLFLRLLKPRASFWVVAYGIDVWSPLPLVYQLGMRLARQVTVLSHFTADRVTKAQGVDSKRVVVLPPALDPDFLAEKEPLPKKFPPAGHILLTVSRLAASEGYKGVDMVIQALPKLLKVVPDAYYIVIGDGDDRQRLEKLAKDLGVDRQVYFAGIKEAEELRNYYQSCDVFVMPSKGEGFGVVFLEAMAFGKPVIGGNHGGTPDVIVDGETGFLVEYGDVDSLVERLISLLRDADLRQKMGQAARQRVMENYTFEHFQQRLKQLLIGGK